jgi:hypothetical protein
MPSLTQTLAFAALCVSGVAAHDGVVHNTTSEVNCTELGGVDAGDMQHHLRRLDDGMHGGHTGMGAVPLVCSELSQLFNVEDMYLSIASCDAEDGSFTYRACEE